MVSSHSCQPLFFKTEESKLERSPLSLPTPWLLLLTLGLRTWLARTAGFTQHFGLAWLAFRGLLHCPDLLLLLPRSENWLQDKTGPRL